MHIFLESLSLFDYFEKSEDKMRAQSNTNRKSIVESFER